MRQDRIDHLGRFSILLCEVAADLRMGPFHFVINGLAQVMEQSGPARQFLVHTALGRHDTGEIGDFPGMHQHILAVARPILEPPDELDDFRVYIMNAEVEGSFLSLVFHCHIQFLPDFIRDLFDPGRMDPAVLHQPLNGQPRDLSSERIVAGQDNRLRRIVDDEIDPGCRLERPDVPSFPPDDSSLHLVVGKIHDRYGCLGNVIAGVTLDRQADDVLGLLVGFFLGLVLDPLDRFCGLELGFILHRDHQLALGLLRGHIRDLFQHLPLFPEALLEPLFLLDRHFFPARQFPFAADHV